MGPTYFSGRLIHMNKVKSSRSSLVNCEKHSKDPDYKEAGQPSSAAHNCNMQLDSKCQLQDVWLINGGPVCLQHNYNEK